MNRTLVSLYRNTNLLSAIRRHLSSQRRARVTFLRWHGTDHLMSEQNLRVVSYLLDLPLIILPENYSVTHDARLLKELAAALHPVKKLERRPRWLAELDDALEHLPYGAALEDSALKRIGSLARQKRLAIAALSSHPNADSAVRRMLEWARRMELHTVLVLAHRKPPGQVSTVQVPLEDLYDDIDHFTGLRRGVPKDLEVEGAAQPTDAKFNPPPSFFQALLTFIRSESEKYRRRERKQSSVESPPAEPTDPPPSAQKGRSVERDWAELLARISEPNWALAHEILRSWAGLQRWLQGYYAKLSRRSADVPPSQLPDNSEEREILEGRLRLLWMLKKLYPNEFEAAVHDLDGADQFYRVHLILCGHTASDSLLAHSLMPFWKQWLEEPLFNELMYSCFDTASRGNALVARFESRSQLHSLLTRVNNGYSQGSRADLISPMLKAHRDWVAGLADLAQPPENQPQPVAVIAAAIRNKAPEGRDKLFELAEEALKKDLTASDALHAAQLLLSAYELTFDKFENPMRSVFPLIQQLTDRAISRSKGAIRVDAMLLQARALALRGRRDEAIEILRGLRWRDPLIRAAARVEEGFVSECDRDYLEANAIYQEVLGVAEVLGADELVARAASGCLRCDARATVPDPDLQLALRARIVIQIQSARAPELFPMSKRSQPRMFISYRRETRNVTEKLHPALIKIALSPWNDTTLEAYESFSPVIHQRLYESDAIVLLLSRNYFNSPWCIHELHFALGQHEMRGVPLFWAWCEEAPKQNGAQPADPVVFAANMSCAQRARTTIERGFDQTDAARRGYDLKHVQDRLQKLFGFGRLLNDNPIPYVAVEYELQPANRQPKPTESVMPDGFVAAIECAVQTMKASVDYLYRRARLVQRPQPGSGKQSGDDASPGFAADPPPTPSNAGASERPGQPDEVSEKIDLGERNAASVHSGMNTEYRDSGHLAAPEVFTVSPETPDAPATDQSQPH